MGLTLLWLPLPPSVQVNLVDQVLQDLQQDQDFLDFLYGQDVPCYPWFLVFLACQEDQGNLAFLVDQVRLYHPSFQWLQFHQQDPVNLDLQGYLIHQVAQEGQQYLVDLFLLVCPVDLQDQVFQCCLFLPCVQQVQATLSFLVIQQDPGVLYVLVPL